ncbi:MAG TPA: hypothetical protein VES65_11465 [Solirubrobacteraceae bacterium]|nr:hypothetical protein [Solirubrobacteraceae bacterium]
MTTGETVAITIGAVGVTALVVYLVVKSQKKTIGAPPGLKQAAASQSVGSLIATAGGAAVAQLGKEAGSAFSGWLSDEFS